MLGWTLTPGKTWCSTCSITRYPFLLEHSLMAKPIRRDSNRGPAISWCGSCQWHGQELTKELERRKLVRLERLLIQFCGRLELIRVNLKELWVSVRHDWQTPTRRRSPSCEQSNVLGCTNVNRISKQEMLRAHTKLGGVFEYIFEKRVANITSRNMTVLLVSSILKGQ
jgi:hypothetical protein